MDERTIARFNAKVDRSGGPDACWPWMGAKTKGYGAFSIRLNGKWRTVKAHRVAFFLVHGRWPQPFGLHSCDNPPCCNEAHVFEGTPLDNMRDMVAKGRCKNGSGTHPERIPRGEAHYAAKLTTDIIRSLPVLRRTMSVGAIARLHGVSSPLVSLILSGKRWRHITGL